MHISTSGISTEYTLLQGLSIWHSASTLVIYNASGDGNYEEDHIAQSHIKRGYGIRVCVCATLLKCARYAIDNDFITISIVLKQEKREADFADYREIYPNLFSSLNRSVCDDIYALNIYSCNDGIFKKFNFE